MTQKEFAGERLVAVLIDVENVGLASIQWLFDQLSDVGRITIKRAYADWSSSKSKRDQTHELGIEPIHVYHSDRKNSSDIRLVIDAMELLHNSPIDIFVIVSSDSDFIPLINKLRSFGKVVIVAGKKETTSSNLSKYCDRYLFLEENKPIDDNAPVLLDTITNKQDSDSDWARLVHKAWSQRAQVKGQSIPGPIAATNAAKILGVKKLSSSRFKTLEGLLKADPYLHENWIRNGNIIIRN